MCLRLARGTAVVVFFLALLVCCQVPDSALEQAKAIPQYPGSTYMGEFTTGFPDDLPGSGISYQSDDPAGTVLDFYLRVVPQYGWTITQVIDYTDEAVPKQLVMEKGKWRGRILIINDEPRRIRIRVEGR